MLDYFLFLQLWTLTKARLDQSVSGQEQPKTFICVGIRKLVDDWKVCGTAQRPCWKIIDLFFFFFFFFLHWHYNPLWALACQTMSFHFFLSATNSLHLLTPSTWRSLSPSSFHLFPALSPFLVPSSSWVKIFLGILSSSILSRWHNQLKFSQFYHPNYTGWGVQLIKLLIMQTEAVYSS